MKRIGTIHLEVLILAWINRTDNPLLVDSLSETKKIACEQLIAEEYLMNYKDGDGKIRLLPGYKSKPYTLAFEAQLLAISAASEFTNSTERV